jgi:hypothetical protein
MSSKPLQNSMAFILIQNSSSTSLIGPCLPLIQLEVILNNDNSIEVCQGQTDIEVLSINNTATYSSNMQ